MAQTKRVQGVATTVAHTARGIMCTYHNTVVAYKEGNIVVLNSGRWKTATTKLRMNQFANQFCDGAFKVYQHKGEWYVENRVRHETQLFEDGMQFSIAPQGAREVT